LIPVYNKYKDRGFQIISFAREMKEGAMEAAAAHDGYPWTSTAEINDKYKIWEQNGVRSSAGGGYLIDEHGIILAVYPSAEELEAILKRRL
ncbi:MAG: AhpC/TSA family protein, partial [Prevotella sp.]|nr:AhpC/TSA family protein [Prevotella sp.]